MANDWYTSDNAHLLTAKKGSSFRRSDAKYEAADVLETDVYVEGRLFEPIPIATPTGQSGSYLPFYRTTQFAAGRWQEILLLQTARNLFPAMGKCTTTEATPNVHAITLRDGQDPVNMGRHWERENTIGAESERIDIIGVSLNSYHAECSQSFPVAVQTLDWNVNFTKNTSTDDLAKSEHSDEPFKWSMFTFPTFTYNSETIEADIIGWAFDVRNTVRITGLDSNGYFEKAKYIPLTMITTTLEIIPYGHNAFELMRTKLESYATDLDLTVKCARNATTDYIQWPHDKCYCQPYTLSALKRPGSVEQYFLVMSQLNTGSLAIEAKDQYNDNYYENP
jgi:hypothetical protein